jgi:putative transport protein
VLNRSCGYVGTLACKTLKLNFMTVSGLLAGSPTGPPALAFTGSLAKSDAPTVSCATVYPLTMLLRSLTAQALGIMVCS